MCFSLYEENERMQLQVETLKRKLQLLKQDFSLEEEQRHRDVQKTKKELVKMATTRFQEKRQLRNQYHIDQKRAPRNAAKRCGRAVILMMNRTSTVT